MLRGFFNPDTDLPHSVIEPPIYLVPDINFQSCSSKVEATFRLFISDCCDIHDEDVTFFHGFFDMKLQIHKKSKMTGCSEFLFSYVYDRNS